MNNYIKLVNEILEQGVDTDSRAGMCRMLTHKTLSYDLSKGFPRLSSRFVPFKSVMVELEGFLGGITSKAWYQDRGCSYWRHWGNPEVVAKKLPPLVQMSPEKTDLLSKEIQKFVDDLGPIYGYQHRRFDQLYTNESPITEKLVPIYYEPQDQVQTVLDTLINNPQDRRMYVSAWNPKQVSQMALRPCHISWKVDKFGDQLDLRFTMASSDIILGLPSNIQYYAALLHLLARHANLKVGKLTGTLDNAHVYHNLLPQAKELVTRQSHPLPRLEFEEYENFWEWDHTKVKCVGYKHSGKLVGEVSI